MDARIARLVLLLAVASSLGAGYRTPNFAVQAPTAEFARQVCEAAEQYRKSLALEWLGHELPRWSEPCPITVRVGPNLGAGGVTSFMFDRGRPFGWRMSIQGSAERILDSVLPHEITHTIFATHFGGPLPRWADEGACTTVEHVSERTKHYQHLYRYLMSNRGIPFNQMFAMTEYPPDIMPLYAQGHSVVEYLLLQGGRQRFVQFLEQGMQSKDWNHAIRTWYSYRDLSDLQVQWVEWLRSGRQRPMAAQPIAQSGIRPDGSMPIRPETAMVADSTWRSRSRGDVTETPAGPATLMRGQGGTAGDSWYARQRSSVRIHTATRNPDTYQQPGGYLEVAP